MAGPGGRIVTNEATGEKAWWDGQRLTPLTADQIATGRAAPDGPVGVDTSQDRETLSKFRDAATKALDVAQAAEKFVEINRNQPTGGWRSIGLPWGGGNLGDLEAGFNENTARMKSITSRIAPANRVVGSGSSSDKDVDFQVSGFTNIKMPGPANEQIANDWKQEAARQAARAAFMDRWYATRGTLTGATEAFGRFWAQRSAATGAAAAARGDDPRKRADRAISQSKPKATILAVEPD